MAHPPSPRHVLDLAEIDASMGESVGGKAANLGELLRIGANVPPGFCVTTRAYDEACPQLVDLDLPPSEIRARIAGAEFPESLRATLTEAYAALGTDARVAVRSSATAEDLPHASFAGQQDTFLNVIGPDALLDAIRHCWGSLWTDRAVIYRESNEIDPRTVRLAVVVQRMVDAESAGVLFTANPVTGRRGEAVIDANLGLGESVVSGAVNPDHFVIDTASAQITLRRPGDKTSSVHPKPDGGTEARTSAPDERPALTDERIRELASLGAEIETHYDWPQDVEWAIEDGTVWLTQSRPVTTLYPLPEESIDGLRMYFSFNVAQGVYRPITPMGLSMLHLMATGMLRNLGLPIAGPTALRFADGWMFIDITDTTRHPVGRRVLPRVLAMLEARSGKIFDQIKDDPRLAVRHYPLSRLIRALAKVAMRTRAPILATRALLHPKRTRDRVFRIAAKIRSELAGSTASTPRGMVNSARQGLLGITTYRMAGIVPMVLPTLALSQLLPRILGNSVTLEEIQIVFRGIEYNVTTEMDLELWRLAGLAAEDARTAHQFSTLTPSELVREYRAGTLSAPVQEGLDAFLAHHGHRAVAEIDIGMPRWSEDPSYILGAIANYLRTAESGHSAHQRYQQGVREAKEMADRIVARLRRHNRVRAGVARFAMDRVRQLMGLRELPKFCIVLGLAHARKQLHGVGSRLESDGRLDSAEDIFFLNLTEAEEAISGTDQRALVARRRETYQRELRRKHLPRILLSDGTEPETPVQGEAGLSGSSASAGTVTGIAKVVRDPAGVRLDPGEILVAPSTDPGWTPLFLTAGGLVMEMGGPNSHGATVAREYGIPAVVAVPDATTRITSGQRITVHGSSGTVTLE